MMGLFLPKQYVFFFRIKHILIFHIYFYTSGVTSILGEPTVYFHSFLHLNLAPSPGFATFMNSVERNLIFIITSQLTNDLCVCPGRFKKWASTNAVRLHCDTAQPAALYPLKGHYVYWRRKFKLRIALFTLLMG